MKKRKIKSLVKLMTKHEITTYILNHPEWKMPTADEAEALDIEDIDWDKFRVDEELGGHDVVYNKRMQCYRTTHPQFKHQCVLIKK